MKIRILNHFVLFLLFSLSLCSCSKIKTETPRLFDDSLRYHVGIKIETFETQGEVFFDEEKKIHFLYTDPTTPLFGMEEVIGEDTIKTYYKDMEYEREYTKNGLGIIKDVLKLINEVQIKQIKESKVYISKEENYSFTLDFDEKGKEPSKISGEISDVTFEINFIPVA